MRRFLQLALCVLLGLPSMLAQKNLPLMGVGGAAAGGGAAITYVRECHNDGASGASLVVTCTITAGDTVTVEVATTELGGSSPITSVTDTGSSTYTARVSTNGAGEWSAIWGSLAANTATSLTINFSPNTTPNASVKVYTGVSSFGNTAGSTASSTTPLVSVTMQDANNYLSGQCFDYNGSPTSPVGTLVLSGYNLNQASSIITSGYNTQAGTGSLSFGYTKSAATKWQCVGVELRN